MGEWQFSSCLVFSELLDLWRFGVYFTFWKVLGHCYFKNFSFCSIHLSFSFWCTNYSCITSFDIIPHFLINLFCFVIIINIFLCTLVWKVSVVLSLSLLIFFSLGYLKFTDETMQAFFTVPIVFLISTISFRFSLSISISFVCCLFFSLDFLTN